MQHGIDTRNPSRPSRARVRWRMRVKMFLGQTFEHNGKVEHARRLGRELELDNRLEGLHSHHFVASSRLCFTVPVRRGQGQVLSGATAARVIHTKPRAIAEMQ